MTAGSIGRQFATLYAPLDPSSALPPGLDERVVANAYKATRVWPKRVLTELGIRKSGGTVAIRLRKALDDPDARARLCGPSSKVPPLHQAIYQLLISQPGYRPVYKRIVEPSEIVVNEPGRAPFTELNPAEFEARVTADQLDCSWREREIESQTDEEGLALFALAYGLLQPADARSIMAPIIALGTSFRAFFGLTDSATPPLASEVEESDQVSSNSTLEPPVASSPPHLGHGSAVEESDQAPSNGTSEPPVVSAVAESDQALSNGTPDDTAIHQAEATPEERVPHHVGSHEDTRAPSKTQSARPYRGLHTQALAKSLRKLQTRREARKALGVAEVLDDSAFRAARELEVAALAYTREVRQSLRDQWEARTQDYVAITQEYGIQLDVEACPTASEEIAESLDGLESEGAELLRLVAALKQNSATARALNVPVLAVPERRDVRVDLRGAIESIEKQLLATDEALLRAERWKAARRGLEERLRDCASASPASSLEGIGPEDVAALLEYSLVNPDWDTLRPLLFRLWSEHFSWTNTDASRVSEVLEQALGAAASDGDLDRHTEQLCYLERGTLQSLLGLSNAAVVRHVVFATFRESLARRDSLFFSAIWGFERAWTNRAGTLGDRLRRFFASLYRCFVHSRSATLVMMSLVEQSAVAVEKDGANAIVRSRAQDANDAATQLEDAGHAPGLFGRLRFWAMTHQLKPVALAVRAQRRAEVIRLLRVLQQRYKSGELVEDVVRAVGGRNMRADHRDSLARYLDDQIGVVTSWLSRTAAEREGQEDATLGREATELRRFATQLARGGRNARKNLPGSISWLEVEIGRLIARLQAGEVLVPSPSWLGSGALRPPPTQLRSWVAHNQDSLGWRDLLQDQLAEHLLGVRRTLMEAVGELRTAGQLDAAIEAANTADNQDGEVRDALRVLRELKKWRDGSTGEIDTLYARLDTLEQGASDEQGDAIDAVKSELLMILEEIDRKAPDATDSAIDACRTQVTELEREMADGVAHRGAVERWLAAAEVVPPKGASVDRLETLMAGVREAAAARRAHLVLLRTLDAAPTPRVLREAIRNVVSAEDFPDKWPTGEKASDAELYLDNFKEQSERWWNTLEHVEPEDVTSQRIGALAEVFATHLHDEVRAVVRGEPEAARLLTLLTERATWSIPEVFARVSDVGAGTSGGLTVVPKTGKVPDPEEAQTANTESETSLSVPAFLENWRERLSDTKVDKTADRPVTERAFQSFRDGHYDQVLREAPVAWRWLNARKNTRDMDALVAVYAWAHAESVGDVVAQERLEALALVLREEPRLSQRVPSLNDFLVSSLPAVLAGCPVTNHEPQGLTAVVLRMAEDPPGSPARERLGALLRMVDPNAVAQRIWDHFRGSSESAKGRTALLLLLFDLAGNEPLHHLFVLAGENQKYLIGFTALAKRAIAEPSTRLLGAIQQTLVRLSDLRERPFRDYAQRIAGRLRYATGRVDVHIPEELERDPQRSDGFRLSVILKPDEGDPPIRLEVGLVPSSDYTLGDGPPRVLVTTDGVLLDHRTVNFHVKPRTKVKGCALAVEVKGETAAGQLIDGIHRQEVVFGPDQPLQKMYREELLEIYAGYDGKPVSGSAFVGREQELTALEQTLAKPDPGAILIYGVRRLGKTSLLDEVRRRHCLTHRPGSRTLFLNVPVDQLSLTGSEKPFLDQFLQHIRNSVLWEDKNEPFRQKLLDRDVSRKALAEAGRQDETLAEASFLMKLRAYIQRLQRLCPSTMEVESVILVFDEFDKLLEEYRRGLTAGVEELTNQLRHAATEERGLGMILAGSDLMRSILGQYRNALYGSARIVELECFNAEGHRREATQIIAPVGLRNRRAFTADGIRQVVEICGGHPLYMRLLACAAVERSQTRRISGGSVNATVPALLDNAVFPGVFPDVAGTVRQQLQCLNLMDPVRRSLAELFLFVLARYSSLERPYVASSVVERDDRLLNLRQTERWLDVRNELLQLKVIRQDARGWRFAFPILGEVLRASFEYEFDRLARSVAVTSAGAP